MGGEQACTYDNEPRFTFDNKVRPDRGGEQRPGEPRRIRTIAVLPGAVQITIKSQRNFPAAADVQALIACADSISGSVIQNARVMPNWLLYESYGVDTGAQPGTGSTGIYACSVVWPLQHAAEVLRHGRDYAIELSVKQSEMQRNPDQVERLFIRLTGSDGPVIGLATLKRDVFPITDAEQVRKFTGQLEQTP